MAKMISELGADIIDDTIVEKKSRFSKKQKNYIIGISVTVILAIAIGLVYYFAATVWLIDYENMGYIQYAYSAFPDENGEITAQISRVLPNQNYPSDFRIPSEIRGYRITKIGDEAFAGCTGIKKIRMTDNIEYIGDQAFAGCEDLKTIEFSKNITHIGNEAFLNTPFFDNLPEDEAIYTNEVLINIGSGLLEDYDPTENKGTALVSNPSRDMGRIRTYLNEGYHVFDMDTFSVINENNINDYETTNSKKATITQWIDGLFENNDQITLVEVPETLDFVPIKAFKDCSNLQKVIINGENITEIRESAFENCFNLTELHIPEHVEVIQNSAFAGTNVPFDHLPNTIKSLGVNVFEYNEAITEFTFPSSLSEIPANTFRECSNLATFQFEDEESISKFGEGAFEGTGFTSFRVPKYITNLSGRLFYGCENLTKVELFDNVNKLIIPGTETVDRDTHTVSGSYQGVHQIRAEVFKDCPNFSSIVLYGEDGNIKPECTDDKTLYLPSTLERTHDSSASQMSTFSGTKVETVIFPEKIVNIGSYLFSEVTTLKEVIFRNAKTSRLQTIYEGAFLGCTGLREFIIPDGCGTVQMKAFEGCTNIVEVHLPDIDLLDASFRHQLEIERGGESAYTSINQSLFLNCTSLQKVNIRNGITQIAKLAFSNCSSLSYLVIPSSVKTIESNAFDGTDVTIYTDVATTYNTKDETDEDRYETDPAKWANGWDSVDSFVVDGTTTHLGSGKPSKDIGENGNAYIDFSRWDYYLKENGSWEKKSNILLSDEGKPSNEDGKDGNIYVNENTWDYYVKESGSWVLKTNLKMDVNKDSIILRNHVTVDGEYSLTFVVRGEEVILDTVTVLKDGDVNVTIPKTITYEQNEEEKEVRVTTIAITAFFNESLIGSLTYEGTVNEFDSLTLHANWNEYTNITSVTCSDGVVNL